MNHEALRLWFASHKGAERFNDVEKQRRAKEQTQNEAREKRLLDAGVKPLADTKPIRRKWWAL